MTRHSRMLARRWLLLVLGVVFMASHALVLRYKLNHRSLSAAVVAGTMILVATMHLGALGRLYAHLRRRSRTTLRDGFVREHSQHR